MILRGWRRYQKHEQVVADADEAARVAYWAQYDDTWAPEELVGDDGVVLLDRDQLDERSEAYGRTIPPGGITINAPT